jgi:hypothetical protein
MSLSDIFSGACFKSPEARKAADFKKLGRKLAQLADYRLEIMVEDAFEKADARDGKPEPVKVEMVFRHLKPEDITEARLDRNGGLDFLHYLAEDVEAKLTLEVTPVISRPFFWQSDKDVFTYAKLTITLDPNRPYSESRILLAAGAAAQSPAASCPPPIPGHAP